MDNTMQQGGDSAAVTDGRRIYLGNLLYSVKPEDIDAVLQELGLGKYDKIHLSFDPVSGRNPGYCFVEFFHKDDAEQALAALAETEVAGRPLKVGPCIAKAPSQRQGDRQPRARTDALLPAERWGDWRGERRSPASPRPEREDRESDVQTPHKAIQHHKEMTAEGDGRRLYVGGLSMMVNQEQHQEEVRSYFEGFDM
jgi:RNA recognition motif-containing protein